MDAIEEVIRNYIVKEYLEQDDEREINETTPLISGGIVDSFSMVSLKRFLERQYHIQIPDADASAEAFDSVHRIAVLVRRFQPVTATAS
jgi:acyl carrier protein